MSYLARSSPALDVVLRAGDETERNLLRYADARTHIVAEFGGDAESLHAYLAAKILADAMFVRFLRAWILRLP